MEENQKNFQFKIKDEQFKMSSWTGGVIMRCVMVADTAQGVAVRDSKDSAKNTLFFTKDEWEAFIKGVKAGEFG